jgi:hypothetical protein
MSYAQLVQSSKEALSVTFSNAAWRPKDPSKKAAIDALAKEFQCKVSEYVLENMIIAMCPFDLLPQHFLEDTFGCLLSNSVSGNIMTYQPKLDLSHRLHYAIHKKSAIDIATAAARCIAMETLSPILHRDVLGLVDDYMAKPEDVQSPDEIYRELNTIPEGSIALDVGLMEGTGALKSFGRAFMILQSGRIRIDDLANPSFFLECRRPTRETSRRKRKHPSTDPMSIMGLSHLISKDGNMDFVHVDCNGRHAGKSVQRIKCDYYHKKGIFVCFDEDWFDFNVVVMAPAFMRW